MNKDWTGNHTSIYATLGASNHTEKERQNDDYYATDPIAIDVLLKDGQAKINSKIWEPACGEGHLSKRLKQYGYSVFSTDIVYRGYGNGVFDFFTYTGIWEGDIVTNPPYKYALEFIEHALKTITTGNKVFMFLKLQFLEGKARRQLFENSPPKTIYVSSSRIKCAPNGDFDSCRNSAVAYAWFEWEKGFMGEPKIKWIN